MKKLLALLLLAAANAFAFDSSTAFNVVTMSYPSNQMIYNRVVLDAAQKTQSTLTFSVDVKNGGGRPTHDLNGNPLTYSTQTDSAFIRVRFYDTSGALINTSQSQTYTLRNYGSNAGWSAAPGDNLQPWSTASVTYTGSLASVWFIQVEMVGTDGAYWAGNYGPQWRAPTVTIGNSSTNVVYNPEFGIAPNSVKAQGWFNSSNNWATCGVTSGNIPCVTNESGVTANMWGGGYDANGGSLAGQSGGYDGTLTTTSADTAASTGSPTASPTPVYSSNITTAQQTRVNAFTTRTITNNSIYIDQAGDNNTINITQIGLKSSINGVGQQRAKIDGDSNNITVRQGYSTTDNGKNQIEMSVVGDSNALNLNQSVSTAGTSTGSTNNHYQLVDIAGTGNSLTTQQTNTGGVGGHYMETTIVGNYNNVIAKQTDNGNKIMFTAVTGNSNNVDVVQKGTGQHYLDTKLTGNGHTVNVSQDGAAGHRATIDLTNSGGASTVNLIQNSNTSQVFSIQQSCTTPSGCSTTITQQQ